MSYVGRQALEAAAKREYRDVEIEGLGLCRVQSITEGERSECEETERGTLVALIVAKGLVDEQGLRLYTDEEAAQISQFKAGVVTQLCEAIYAASGITSKTKEETEQEAKN